jgi:tetratricopeptide (TPR) repeat protein
MDAVMRSLSPADRTWGILIDGIGGIGKTAVAVEAAHRAREVAAFDAFVFVDAKQNILDPSGICELTPSARTLDEFLNETARVLGQPGITKLASDEKRRALLDVLRGMRALLICDNLETLSKEEQEALADFLRELPQGCKAIVTSRRRGGEGAVWLRVEKLDWDAARHIIESEMTRDTGLANKLRHAEARWQELHDELNGSPLALVHTLGLMRVRAALALVHTLGLMRVRAALALVHTLGLMRVRAALTFDGALAMLRGNRDVNLQKFIFQEARKELTENDKITLGALSFFVSFATFEAWMQVANLSRNALETTIDRLSALSLVDVLAGEERYGLHPLTRAYFRVELLSDANIARETGMRFARYCVNYSKRYGSYDNYKTFGRLETEWTNLDAAANWLWETARVEGDIVGDEESARTIVELVEAIGTFVWISGRWNERVQLNGRAYAAACAILDWLSAGWNAYNVAFVHLVRGQSADATLWAHQCEEMWSRSGGQREQAFVIRLHGLIAGQLNAFDQPEQLLQKALGIWRNLSLDVDIAFVLNDLGTLARRRKDYGPAEQYFRESLDLFRKHSHKDGEVTACSSLGELALDCKQIAQARHWFEQAMPLARELGRANSIAIAQFGLACVEEAEGHPDIALSFAQEALATYKKLQHVKLPEAEELMERLKEKQEAGG